MDCIEHSFADWFVDFEGSVGEMPEATSRLTVVSKLFSCYPHYRVNKRKFLLITPCNDPSERGDLEGKLPVI